MSATIRFLAGFCREHPLDEKIFVVPSFIIGRQIGEALAREAGSWINLRFVTPRTLAAEVMERGGEAKANTPMTSSAELALTDRLVRELQAAGELEYFGRAGVSPGLVRALHRAVRDLRLDGRKAADIRPGLFLVQRKGEELALLVGRYERALDADGLFDSATLLDAAVRAAARTPLPPAWTLALGGGWRSCPEPWVSSDSFGGRVVFFSSPPLFGAVVRAAAQTPLPPAWTLALADVRLSRLESGFIRAAAGERFVLVPGDPVFGLERPRHLWPATRPAGPQEATRLSWLFEPRKAPLANDEEGLDIFRALGPANECREVLRRLYAEKMPFDHVEVLTPPGPVHSNVLHLLAARTGLPVTFGDGIPISFTSPGRLFFGLVDWLESDFSSALLGRLLENGDLVLPAALAARTACRHLRSALIGWGRDRYLERLAALRQKKAAESALIGNEGNGDGAELDEARRADLAAAVAEIEQLEAFVKKLLDVIPRADAAGAYDIHGLYEALAAILKDFGRPDPGLDRRALETLLARLEEVRTEGRFQPLPLGQALEVARAACSELRVGASAPLPGHVHVASYFSGGYSGRPVTFVVGLDEATFPGRGLQDPILLDEERAALSDSLPTAADDLRANLFGLAAALASLRGRVFLSYSSYDVVEGRESFPSSVVLQAFRLIRRDPDLDYAALDRGLPEAAGFLPGGPDRAFDELDWWLGRLAGRGRTLDGPGSVAANFPDLASGLAAAAARAGAALTAYDGIVDIGPLRAEVDPVAGRKAVMSATRLELLAKCPFAYFLRHVLKVRPPEEVEFDRSRWLDPLQRGSLVHEILCELMTEVRKRRETVAAERHAGLAKAIAGKLIARTREEVPPPSEGIFESERRDVLETLEIFLAAEEKREEKGEPLEFEKRIDKEKIGLGGGRSFLLSGSIDRVDRLGRDTYRVLDYKTGSASDYEELVAFGHGQKIQHALYAVALESILAREQKGGKPRVTRSGYLFPSRRGEGLERIIKDFDRGRLRSLLNDLLRLLEEGFFIAGPDAKCGYCDYIPVCASGGPEVTKSKKKILEQLMAGGGQTGKAKISIEKDLRVFEAYDKLGEYK